MANKVINTILSLKDNMSAPLKSASKVIKEANEKLKSAKETLSKYKNENLKSTQAIKKANSEMNDLKKIYSNNTIEIEKAKQAVELYSNKTNLNRKEQQENNNALKSARATLERLQASQNKVTKSIQDSKDAIDNHKKSIASNNEKIKSAREDVKKYSKTLKDNAKSADEAKAKITSWGKSAETAINGAIKRSAQLAIATASLATGVGLNESMNMEGYRTQLDTAVKDTKKASVLMSNAVKFANSTPFETGEVVEATAKMEAYGISSKRWLKDVADMAGATNKSIDQATEAMADAVMGEWERLKEFGIKKEQLIEAAALKYGKNIVFNKKGQVIAEKKMQDVLQEVIQKKFKGGAEKQAKTLKGLWSTITGVTKSSLAKILGMQEDGTIRQGSLYELLKDKIKIVVDLLNQWQEDGTILKIADNVTKAVSTMVSFFHTLFNIIKEYRAVIETVAVFVASAYTAVKVLSILKTAWSTLTTIMAICNGTLAITAMPLGAIAIAIGAVVAVAYLLYNHFDKVVQVFKSCFEWVQNLLKKIPDFVLVLMAPIAPLLLIIKYFNQIKEVATKTFGFIKKLFGFKDKKINLDVNKNTKDESIKKVKLEKDIQSKVSVPKSNYTEIFNQGLKTKPSNENSSNKLFKEPIKQQKEIIKEKQTIIKVTVTGDVYGFDDFKEKVAEAFVKIHKQTNSNVI